MKSFCILGVFLLLSVVELEATSVSEFSCLKRNLTVTADDSLRLYIDGVEITGLPNVEDYGIPDVVDLPCTTRLIAIHGKQGLLDSPAAILASTDDDYVLTNSTWKCSNVSYVGWEGIDFDDSTWMSAIEFGHNGEDDWAFLPNISLKASRIWLRQYISDQEEMDMYVYCRKKLVTNDCASVQYLNGGICLNGINYNVCVCSPEWTGVKCDILISACDPNPCLNGGTCNYIDGDSFACTCPVYWTGVTCESPNYIESLTCGTTLRWANYSASNDFTRLCMFWAPMSDSVGRATECRNTMTGIPLYDNSTGLMEAGGNFGCIVSQDYPNDLSATSYLSCADDYQQDVALGNFTELDRLMVCIRYPYEGLPDWSLCLSSPCAFGGICIDEPNGGYQCICAPGYTGQNCSDEINYCDSDPCANGGSCLPIVNGYVCQCPPGYPGDHCQHDNTSSSACQPVAYSSDDIAIAMGVLLAISLAVNIIILIIWLCSIFRAKKDPFTNPENVLPTEIRDLSNVSSVPSPYEELRRPDESQLHQNNYEKLTPTISHDNNQQSTNQN